MKRWILCLLLLAATASGAAARERYGLNDDWTFFFHDETSADDARHVSLPHTWNLDALAGDASYRRTTANYMRRLYVPAEWEGQRLFLRFHGVKSVADLFVNGRHVGEHRGGFTAFTFEITDKVRFGAENNLMVTVSNTFQNDVLPTSTDQNVYGGIYREVELIRTDAAAISPDVYGADGLFVQPLAVSRNAVEARAAVYVSLPEGEAASVLLTVRDPSGEVVVRKNHRVTARDKGVATIPFTLDAPRLWSPAQPDLYTVTARLECGDLRDEVRVETGFRKIVVSHGGLRINGDSIRLRGVNLYHDRATVANAFSAADYDEDLALLDDVGANALRSVSGPHAQYLYERCDREGVLAWIDFPLVHSAYLGDVFYFPTDRFRANGEQQLREILTQHYNHPSVVMWGVFSMLWPRGDDVLPYVRTLNELAKSLDPTRPTVAVSNQDGELNFITDLIVFRQEVGWLRGSTDDVSVWSRMLHTQWKNLYAGVCYGAPGFPAQQEENPERTSPGACWLPEGNQTHFHEEYARQLAGDGGFWGVWIDALCDYGTARGTTDRNASGMVTLDRRQKKDIYYLYRALWNDRTPTFHLAGRRLACRVKPKQQITLYASRNDSVAPQLRVNGDSVALRRVAEGRYAAQCTLREGANDVVATRGAERDSMRLTIGTALRSRGFEDPRKTAGPR